MDVAVLGATGDVGRAICAMLIERRVLPSTSRLQLVGRADGDSGRAAHGLRTDLIDAHDEHAPLVDVALAPEDVVADVVVVAAGRTVPTRPGEMITRERLAAENLAVFEAYGKALARHGSGHEVVIVVTNPVELGVAVLARELGRHRVIGMGAWLDTLRFRREIALSLGIRRQRVGGFVGGQHGDLMVPLWSTVRIHGLDDDEQERAIAGLRGARSLDDFPDETARAKELLEELEAEGIERAFAEVETWPPDIRSVIRPYLTHQSGAKTANGTAAATADLVDTVLDGRDIVVAGQVALEGEVVLDGAPWHGVLGIPLVIGPDGWRRALLDELPPDEERRMADVAHRIEAMVLAAGGAAVGTTIEPAANGDGEADWLAEIDGEDHVGTLTAVASVFSSRGVSFASIDADATGDRLAVLAVGFRASERLAQVVARTLERLAAVRSVRLTRRAA